MPLPQTCFPSGSSHGVTLHSQPVPMACIIAVELWRLHPFLSQETEPLGEAEPLPRPSAALLPFWVLFCKVCCVRQQNPQCHPLGYSGASFHDEHSRSGMSSSSEFLWALQIQLLLLLLYGTGITKPKRPCVASAYELQPLLSSSSCPSNPLRRCCCYF